MRGSEDTSKNPPNSLQKADEGAETREKNTTTTSAVNVVLELVFIHVQKSHRCRVYAKTGFPARAFYRMRSTTTVFEQGK